MSNTKIHQLQEHEIEILQKSEEDIKQGKIISQENLDKEDLEWLSKLEFS
jgi:hypothetical protein